MNGRSAAQRATALPADLAPVVLERLHNEGVDTCEAWLALGAGRGRIFGITKRVRRAVDAAVAAELARGAP